MLHILILAAGQSSRMRGGDKLMEPVDGAPLIATMARRALDTGCPVLVCLPPAPTRRHQALSDLPVTRVSVPDAYLGMSRSLATGVAALPARCTAVMVLPADMPEITAKDMKTLANAQAHSPDAILRGASETGTPGHPVIFPASCFDRIISLTGDTGARSVIAGFEGEKHLIPLPGNHALTDLDTPEDWAKWRARP